MTAPPASVWTGGQYSLYRILLGGCLAVHFARLGAAGTELFSSAGVLADGEASPFLHLFPNVFTLLDAPAFVAAVLTAGVVLSILLAVGRLDRVAALVLWSLGACLFGRNPLVADASWPFVGMLLVMHAAMPGRPFLSWGARGRVDPAGGWWHRRDLWIVAWILMAAGYAADGLAKVAALSGAGGAGAFAEPAGAGVAGPAQPLAVLAGTPLAGPTWLGERLLGGPSWTGSAFAWTVVGLELAFAPLVLVRRLRPWAWSAMVAVHTVLLVLVDATAPMAGMLLLHAFTFDPAWLPARAASTPDGTASPPGRTASPSDGTASPPGRTASPSDGTASPLDTVFFDGGCGLCHRTVRLLLAEDTGGALRFAPLEGETFAEALEPDRRAELPDSLVLVTAGGEVLVRSAAVLRALDRMGGAWRALAILARLVPRPVRDLVYDGVARVRKTVFPRPDGSCPLVPPELASRFLP